MRQVQRSEVKVGQRFRTVRGPKPEYAAECMAIESIHHKLRQKYQIGAENLWHVCLFNGVVTWSYPDSLVWVED
jgi:hypothetical protein